MKGDYIPLDKVKATLAKARKDIIKRGQLPPEPVTILDQRSGKAVQAFKRADLVAAGVMSKEAAAAAKKPDHAADAREQEARFERQRKEGAAASERRWALLQHMRQLAAGRERTVFELRMVVAAALQGVAWPPRHGRVARVASRTSRGPRRPSCARCPIAAPRSARWRSQP